MGLVGFPGGVIEKTQKPIVKDISLQLYTVRHALERNVEKTLQEVRSAGYVAVEIGPLPPGLTPRRLGDLLRTIGLRVAAAHSELPLGERRDEVLSAAAELGATSLIWHGWPRDPACDSLDGIRRLAERYGEAAGVAREHGLRFGLHNHWWECEFVEGSYPYQLLHQLLPSSVFMELDVYWARTAGLDPVRMLDELGTRVAMLHLKDGPAMHGQPMTALGDGVVNIPAIVRASQPMAELVVELDECATSPMDAARRSLEYLHRMLNEGTPN